MEAIQTKQITADQHKKTPASQSHRHGKQQLPSKTSGCEQNIDPWRNPAHVLSPPRHWIENLRSGHWPWMMFRFAYKNLLSSRWNAEPQRFVHLLPRPRRPLPALVCGCGYPHHCHVALALEFLQDLFQSQQALECRVQAVPAPLNPAPDLHTILATLAESPTASSAD